MSLTSKSTLSLRKKDVQQQKKAGTAYRRLVFAHKASAGETGVTFTALVQPSEMAALGFTNPSSADILAANILFYKKNLTVISSARGVLMQDLSYTVPTSQRIEFQGFTALQDEIFTFLLETGVKDGLNVVDASPIIATGELAIGDTDFNVGTPFEVNKYNTQQVGSVLVFRDGVIQFRNPSNGTVGGNYQEVDNGSGLGTIIRFNEAPVSEASSIVVWGNLLAERPDGSMMAAIESLAGQLDQMIPTLAALAGVPETTFQAQPNNQDLKAFGDKVQAIDDYQDVQDARLTALEANKLYCVYENNTPVNTTTTPGSFNLFKYNSFVEGVASLYNPSTGTITFPIAGLWRVDASVSVQGTLTTAQYLRVLMGNEINYVYGNGANQNWITATNLQQKFSAGSTLQVGFDAAVVLNSVGDTRFNRLKIVYLGPA